MRVYVSFLKIPGLKALSAFPNLPASVQEQVRGLYVIVGTLPLDPDMCRHCVIWRF